MPRIEDRVRVFGHPLRPEDDRHHEAGSTACRKTPPEGAKASAHRPLPPRNPRCYLRRPSNQGALHAPPAPGLEEKLEP